MMRTFEAAAFELQRQSIARGFGGRLDDLEVALCEDRRSVTVYAFYSLDEPLIARQRLALQAQEFCMAQLIGRCLLQADVQHFGQSRKAQLTLTTPRVRRARRS